MSQIDELRQIIVGDNSEQLAELKNRIEALDLRAQDVAEVLVPAIDMKMRSDASLVSALNKPVSQGLKKAIQGEPEVYAEILYPAIAPSIRTAISQSISSLLSTINQTIESATTVGGLRARIQSLRTGVPYAELLLRRSLLFRVEHLYLIDRESGLLIGECRGEGESRMDSDAVSAMFSAIQSFVQDSFSGDSADRLTDFKVGAHTVWIAHGPHAMLACVLLGDAPEELKANLYDTLDAIRIQYASQLQNYDGDPSEFDGLQDHLLPLMQSQLRESEEDVADKGISWGPKLVYFALLLALGYLIYGVVDRQAKLATLNHYFDAAPGVVVTKSYWQGGKVTVEGLLDPDAELPFALLAEHGLDMQKLNLHLTPFRSLETQMELKRFVNELSPPQSTALEINQGKLDLSGQAPVEWLIMHNERLRQLSSDNRLQISKLFASKTSLQNYLIESLKVPAGDKRDQLVMQLSETPWKQIDLTDLMYKSSTGYQG